MKYSKYNFLLNSKYCFLLYNSASNAFVRLNENLYQLLCKLEKGEISIKQLDDKVLDTLRKAKIIVDDDDVVLYKRDCSSISTLSILLI